MSRGTDAPLLGVNLGHVGFLAEAEREDLEATVEHIVTRDYTVEERMTLDVRVARDGEVVARSLGAQRGQRREGRPASGCWSWRSRSTGGRCRRSALTAS